MTKLTNLILDLSSENIDGENIDALGNTISYFDELTQVELNLKDNYIDNIGYVKMLDDLNLVNSIE